VNRQIGVGDSKNVIVFDPLLTGHVIRMRSGRVRIFNGNQRERLLTHNSRTDRRRVLKLGGKFGHVTRHVHQLFNVKRSQGHAQEIYAVKGFSIGDARESRSLTRSRDVSADKNAITRQWMVISTSNLVRIIDVRVDAYGIFSRSVGQTNRK